MEPQVLYPHSQTDVLRRRLEEVGVRHGADARVDLEVEVVTTDARGPTVLFCRLKDEPDRLRVRRFARKGDGKSLPATVRLNGFQVPANLDCGDYRLENARIIANGFILIEVDRGTAVERVGEHLVTA